jgi:uncharacterized membrane protein
MSIQVRIVATNNQFQFSSSMFDKFEIEKVLTAIIPMCLVVVVFVNSLVYRFFQGRCRCLCRRRVVLR